MLHLFHPALVHFGVAFIAAGGLLEAWGLLRDHEPSRRHGAPLLAAGTLTLIAVIASGYVAANTIELREAARETLKLHERNGWVLLAALVLLHFWKAWSGGRLPRLQERLYALALVAVVGWMAWSAYLGGRLVYTFGTGVSSGGTAP
jgi:uncharacterized membrane protein